MRILLSATVLFSLSISAQTTFAPIGAKWTYLQRYWDSADSNLVHVECTGDSVFQGFQSSFLALDGPITCPLFYEFVRSSNDTTLYWNDVTSSWEILFVRNAVPGSAWMTLISNGGMTDTMTTNVTDTNSVLVSGITLKVLQVQQICSHPEFSPNGSGWVYERLGDLNYLFAWGLGICDGDQVYPLRCYEDTEITWLNPQFEQCDLSTGIADPFVGPELMVSPTVIDRGGTIHISSAEPVTIELLDATGRIAQYIRSNATITIEKPGVYFVRASIGSRPIDTRRVLVR